jgi:PRELI-like family
MPVDVDIRRTFEHAWSSVSYASWIKYPSKQRQDILVLDILDRSLDPETGVLTTTRVCQATSSTPGWFNLIFGTPKYVYFLDHCTVDPKEKSLTLQGRNATFSSLLSMIECCTYRPHPTRSDWTDFTQSATVLSKTGKWGIASKIEHYCAGAYEKNAARGANILEEVALRLQRERVELAHTIDDARERIRIVTDDAGQFISTVTKEASSALEVAYAKPRSAAAEERDTPTRR